MFGKKVCKVVISKSTDENLNVITEARVAGVIAAVTRKVNPWFASETTKDGKHVRRFFQATKRQFKVIEKVLETAFSNNEIGSIYLEIVR